MNRMIIYRAALGILTLVALSSMRCSGGGTGDANTNANGTGDSNANDNSTGVDNVNGDDDSTIIPADLLAPGDLDYVGAFALPGDETPPATFAWGASAMAFNPAGDAEGAADGFPGSLFIVGHARTFDHLDDGCQLAEVAIPVPLTASSVDDMPSATIVQSFSNVLGDHFDTYWELPQVGLEYLDVPDRGPQLHVTFGQHFHDNEESTAPTQGFFSTDLADPQFQGEWFVGTADWHLGGDSPYRIYSVNAYLFEIPAQWADEYVAGRTLATGRYREGGWSGKGPAIHAYVPWLDDDGTLPASGDYIPATSLLLYDSSGDTADITTGAMTDYQHSDEWEGAAWITSTGGQTAVVFGGTKSTGDKHWYGWINSSDPERPCVEQGLLFDVCQLPDGSSCPAEDYAVCNDQATYRGWWGSRFDAQLIFYDPADLAAVASGSMAANEVQPYASLDIDEHLFLPEPTVEPLTTGSGDQRKYRVGPMAYDRDNDLLYIVEWFAQSGMPVIHVFRII